MTNKPPLPSFLFHGTSTVRAVEIIRHGLAPQACLDGVKRKQSIDPRVGIYLASNWLLASEFAALAIDRWGGDSAVFAIPFKALDQSQLQPDDYDLADAIQDLLDPTSTAQCGAFTGGELRRELSSFQTWRDVPWEVSLSSVSQVMYGAPVSTENLLVVELQAQKPIIVPLAGSRLAQLAFETNLTDCLTDQP